MDARAAGSRTAGRLRVLAARNGGSTDHLARLRRELEEWFAFLSTTMLRAAVSVQAIHLALTQNAKHEMHSDSFT